MSARKPMIGAGGKPLIGATGKPLVGLASNPNCCCEDGVVLPCCAGPAPSSVTVRFNDFALEYGTDVTGPWTIPFDPVAGYYRGEFNVIGGQSGANPATAADVPGVLAVWCDLCFGVCGCEFFPDPPFVPAENPANSYSRGSVLVTPAPAENPPLCNDPAHRGEWDGASRSSWPVGPAGPFSPWVWGGFPQAQDMTATVT